MRVEGGGLSSAGSAGAELILPGAGLIRLGLEHHGTSRCTKIKDVERSKIVQ